MKNVNNLECKALFYKEENLLILLLSIVVFFTTSCSIINKILLGFALNVCVHLNDVYQEVFIAKSRHFQLTLKSNPVF